MHGLHAHVHGPANARTHEYPKNRYPRTNTSCDRHSEKVTRVPPLQSVNSSRNIRTSTEPRWNWQRASTDRGGRGEVEKRNKVRIVRRVGEKTHDYDAWSDAHVVCYTACSTYTPTHQCDKKMMDVRSRRSTLTPMCTPFTPMRIPFIPMLDHQIAI